MSDIALTDPYDLEPHEQRRLARLLEMSPEQFDDHVRAWATSVDPDESQDVVFRHPELVELTLESLSRLIRASELEKKRQGSPHIRGLLANEIRMLGGVRKAIRPYVHRAISEAAAGNVRDRAERVLGRVHVPELKAIMRDIEGGMSEKEAEKAARARAKELAARK